MGLSYWDLGWEKVPHRQPPLVGRIREYPLIRVHLLLLLETLRREGDCLKLLMMMYPITCMLQTWNSWLITNLASMWPKYLTLMSTLANWPWAPPMIILKLPTYLYEFNGILFPFPRIHKGCVQLLPTRSRPAVSQYVDNYVIWMIGLKPMVNVFKSCYQLVTNTDGGNDMYWFFIFANRRNGDMKNTLTEKPSSIKKWRGSWVGHKICRDDQSLEGLKSI